MKSTRVYKLSMLALAALTAALLFMTLLHIKYADIFAGPLTAVLLTLAALLTAVCLCLDQPKGNRLYKIGFYILHGALVILLTGFLLSRFLGDSYPLTFPTDGTTYTAVKQEDGSVTDLGIALGVTDTKTEYYTDAEGRETKNPKHYEAILTVSDGKTAPRTESLTVNHPLRVTGARNYKIYLMSLGPHPITGQPSATLLIKSDPAEYTILAGIGLLLVGSLLMCLLAPVMPAKPAKTKEETEK